MRSIMAARVMMPERDWTWLKAVKARLYAAAPASAPTGPVITSVQLLDLGQQLMDESKPAPGTPISMDDAVRYRDGLMIALLAFIPIRRKNLAALEIGRHLVREGDGWFVIIPREETKTGTPIEFPVPELLKSYLAFYLDIVRPRMLRRPTCAALWVSSQGRCARIWRDRPHFQPALDEPPRLPHHPSRRTGCGGHNLGYFNARSDRRCPRPACAQRSAHHYQALQSGERDRSQSGT